MNVERACRADAGAILAVQKAAYQSEARIYADDGIPPLTQTVAELAAEFSNHCFYVVRAERRVIGSIKVRVVGDIAHIARLAVVPEYQRQGIGSRLLAHAESAHAEVAEFELFTGHKSTDNLAIYHHKGYREVRRQVIHGAVEFVFMRKPNRRVG